MENLIYLTPEAEHDLEKGEPIFGKGDKKPYTNNIQTDRLPIDEFVEFRAQ